MIIYPIRQRAAVVLSNLEVSLDSWRLAAAVLVNTRPLISIYCLLRTTGRVTPIANSLSRRLTLSPNPKPHILRMATSNLCDSMANLNALQDVDTISHPLPDLT